MATRTRAGLPLVPAASVPSISAPSPVRGSVSCAVGQDLNCHERLRVGAYSAPPCLAVLAVENARANELHWL